MTDKKDSLLENELQGLRKEYLKHQMTDMQTKLLCQKIEEAKTMNKNQFYPIKYAAIAAAALIGLFVILPNTSGTIAHAVQPALYGA